MFGIGTAGGAPETVLHELVLCLEWERVANECRIDGGRASKDAAEQHPTGNGGTGLGRRNRASELHGFVGVPELGPA